MSSPPNWVRALLLIVLLVLLGGIAVDTLAPGDDPSDPTTWLSFGGQSFWTSVLWVIALAAGVAGVAVAIVYLCSSLKTGAAARTVRSWLGWVLLILLAVVLLKVGWDGLTDTGTSDKAAWKRWLADHEVVRGALIVLVTACVLIPLGELLAIVLHKAWRSIRSVLAQLG
jgi:hypothetical protein